MNWNAVKDYEEMSRTGAARIYDAISRAAKERRRINLGLATGNTMISLYRYLAESLNRSKTDLASLHTYNLDEYLDDRMHAVPHTHPLSYRKYMHENLFSRFEPELNFSESHIHFPDPANPESFDSSLADAGGLDFQLLGIGFNGHIAFNEPMSASEISVEEFAELPTRVIKLEELTLRTNARLTAGGSMETVPRHAVTMGMKQILAAKEIMLLACFSEQEQPLSRIKNGKPSPDLPASYLLNHRNASVIYTSDKIKLR